MHVFETLTHNSYVTMWFYTTHTHTREMMFYSKNSSHGNYHWNTQFIKLSLYWDWMTMLTHTKRSCKFFSRCTKSEDIKNSQDKTCVQWLFSQIILCYLLSNLKKGSTIPIWLEITCTVTFIRVQYAKSTAVPKCIEGTQYSQHCVDLIIHRSHSL